MGKDHLVWFVIDVIEGLEPRRWRAWEAGEGPPGYTRGCSRACRSTPTCRPSARRGGSRSAAGPMRRSGSRPGTRSLTTEVARFRAAAAGGGGPLEDLFLQVLFVLAAAGLGRLDVVSVDGDEIWANASRQANRTEGGLRRLAGGSWTTRPAPTARAAAAAATGTATRRAGAPDSCGCSDGGTLRPGRGRAAVPPAAGAGPPGRGGSRPGWRGLEPPAWRGRRRPARGRRGVPGRVPAAGARRGPGPGRDRGRGAELRLERAGAVDVQTDALVRRGGAETGRRRGGGRGGRGSRGGRGWAVGEAGGLPGGPRRCAGDDGRLSQQLRREEGRRGLRSLGAARLPTWDVWGSLHWTRAPVVQAYKWGGPAGRASGRSGCRRRNRGC